MENKGPYIKHRRVVITGMGACSPLGVTLEQTWANAVEGKSGISNIEYFDTEGCPVRFAGEIKDFDPARPIGPHHDRSAA